jgi:hypothetical protein
VAWATRRLRRAYSIDWGTPGAWSTGQSRARAVSPGHLGPAICLGKCSVPAALSVLVFPDTEDDGGSIPPAPTISLLTSANVVYQGSLTGSQGHRPDGMSPHSGQEHFTC